MPQQPESIEIIKEIVSQCTYLDWNLDVVSKPDCLYIQVRATTPDTVTGIPYEWKGRKWLLSRYMTNSEIVRTCYLAYRGAVMHEFDELFKYEDKAIYNPHHDVVSLWTHAHKIDVRDD